MCNRFRGPSKWSQIPRAELAASLFNFPYNPNVAPTEMTPVVMYGRGDMISIDQARFGLYRAPKDGKRRPPILNLRMDTLRAGSFRNLVKGQRCVVPAEGFYEWREEDGRKQPYFFFRRDGEPIIFAGLWDMATLPDGTVPAFSLITDEPNELVRPYHDRMPVILADSDQWLSASGGLADLEPLPAAAFDVRPVSQALNNVREKRIEEIEP